MRPIPITTGGHVWLPHGAPLRTCVEALRRMGYRLTTGARGRLMAERLH